MEVMAKEMKLEERGRRGIEPILEQQQGEPWM
jgi:hypothetical protein